jgi:hypothetical protein
MTGVRQASKAVSVDRETAQGYYLEMLNGLSGLLDDLGANNAPREAISLLHDVLILCRRDFEERFGSER